MTRIKVHLTSFLVMLGEISLKKGMSFQVSVPRRLEAPLSVLLQQVPDRSNLCLEKWLILQLWNRDDPGAITSYHLHTQTLGGTHCLYVLVTCLCYGDLRNHLLRKHMR